MARDFGASLLNLEKRFFISFRHRILNFFNSKLKNEHDYKKKSESLEKINTKSPMNSLTLEKVISLVPRDPIVLTVCNFSCSTLSFKLVLKKNSK